MVEHIVRLEGQELVPTGQWCYISLIPALVKERQIDFCEFKDSMVYRVTFGSDSHRKT